MEGGCRQVTVAERERLAAELGARIHDELG